MQVNGNFGGEYIWNKTRYRQMGMDLETKGLLQCTRISRTVVDKRYLGIPSQSIARALSGINGTWLLTANLNETALDLSVAQVRSLAMALRRVAISGYELVFFLFD